MQVKVLSTSPLTSGVIGNTCGFGPQECKFEPCGVNIFYYLCCMENAEELLIYLKNCVERLEDDAEAIITPTMYDPNQLQNDVTFIIMEKVKGGTIPRFKINVKDLEGIRNWDNVKKYG
jgi:hypothetical protein